VLDGFRAHDERQHRRFHSVQLSKPASTGNQPLVLPSAKYQLIRPPSQLAGAAEGLQYLHDHKIVHGDIKGVSSRVRVASFITCAGVDFHTRLGWQPNILITNGSPPQACLSDFGFSTLTPTTSFAMTTHGIDPAGGTTLYMAPELIYPSKFGLPCSQLSKEGDIYAIGMVVYEIVMGIRPFGVEGFRVEEVMYVVLDGARPARPGDPEDVGFGPGVWGLVEACWGEDRTQRPNIRDVRQCLTAAADLSPPIPPGPVIVVSPSREISTGSIPPTSQSMWFTSFFIPLPTHL
jgi:serine/threonine protein kinase